MKRAKKVIVYFMIMAILFTNIPVENILAADISTETAVSERQSFEETSTYETTGAESAENTVKSENANEKSDENAEISQNDVSESIADTEKIGIKETENIEDVGKTERVATENVGDVVRLENTEEEGSDGTVPLEGKDTEDIESTENFEAAKGAEESEILQRYDMLYMMLEERNVELNSSQQIVVGIDCETEITKAELKYHNQETGVVFEVGHTNISGGAILFEFSFGNENQTGIYELDEIHFWVNGEEQIVLFSEVGITAYFGVNQETNVQPDAVVEADSVDVDMDMDVVQLDENGNVTSDVTLEEAIENARAETAEMATYNLRTATKDVIVVLDPGHDSTHAGAQVNGLAEEALNIKIAAYCKKELEEYNGVRVYLTRSVDGSCPYPGTTAGGCNEKRVEYAKSVGANIYVSLHNNSATNTSAKGAMVFYPNTNYNFEVSQTGKELAQIIENHLVKLGLYDRGITIRNAQDDKYPDGSAADYYGVIRNSKLVGIPAIIVEHSFMSNSEDVSNFLNSDEKLKNLGIADATAIAEYYGLTKGINISVDKVNVSNVDNNNGTANMEVSGLKPNDKIQKVSFAVWSKADQSDLVWYDASNDGTGNYKAPLSISKHNYNVGTYYVDAYAYDTYGTSHYLGGDTCVFSVDISAENIEINALNAGAGTFEVVIKGISSSAEIQKIQVPVWSKADYSDIYWYTAVKQSDGSYLAHINIENHGYAYTTYLVDVYGTLKNGMKKYLGGREVKFAPDLANVTVTSDATEMKCTVDISGLNMVGNLENVKVAVWSQKGGQDDLVWYTASNISQGTWKTEMDVTRHKTAGLYYFDAYVTDAAGNKLCIGSARINISELSMQKMEITNQNNGRGKFDVVLTGISSKSGVSKVQVPVWSKTDQSDLYWYTAEKQNGGTYVAHVNISNHKYNYGNYYVDVYGIGGNGIKQYLGGKKVAVNEPKATVKAWGNSDQTWFAVQAADVGIQGGVNSVSVAVWSKEGGQDDLIWYNASMGSEGVWKASFQIAKHKTSGKYYADVYAKNVEGKSVYVGGTTFEVDDIEEAKVSIESKNEKTGNFAVKIDNLKYISGIKTVRVAVWSKGDQSDLYWYTANKMSESTYEVMVNLAKHNYNYGSYYVHVYADAMNGISQYVGGMNVVMNAPEIKFSVSDNGTQTWFAVVASDVEIPGGVKNVSFAVWSKEGGQDDLVWYSGVKLGDTTWKTSIQIAKHKTAGNYYVHAYAQRESGESICIGETEFIVSGPSASSVELQNYNEADGVFGVKVLGVSSLAGIANVKVAVWSAGDQSDLVWYDATVNADGTYQIGADVRNHQNNVGKYYADAYITDKNGIRIYAGGVTCSMINVTNILHLLMGSSVVTVKQMVQYFNSSASYPVYYANTEAATIEAFCQIYLEECKAEGVKAEVAFCQAMKETGFLKFGGNVNITQYNFAGIGSTGDGIAGESYADIRTGIRAQVQHLKAYGCEDSLNQACVDNRFKYVTRNSAPYVEWLGVQENPYGKGWATAEKYGYDIVKMVGDLITY